MKPIQGALLMAAVMSMPALASNWVPLGDGGDGQFLVFVDLDSIQKKGSHVTVLEKFAYRTPVKYTGGRLIYAIKSNQSYECEQRKTLLLHSFAYSDAEATKAIESIRYTDNPSHYYPVSTTSFEERVLNLICANTLAAR
jgi:hypothetical protein